MLFVVCCNRGSVGEAGAMCALPASFSPRPALSSAGYSSQGPPQGAGSKVPPLLGALSDQLTHSIKVVNAHTYDHSHRNIPSSSTLVPTTHTLTHSHTQFLSPTFPPTKQTEITTGDRFMSRFVGQQQQEPVGLRTALWDDSAVT